MEILYLFSKELDIHKIPPYRAERGKQKVVSRNDKIAFMTQFYPPSKFAKLTFSESQTSASSSSISQRVTKDLPNSKLQLQVQSKDSFSQNDERQYQVSEIKPQNREFLPHLIKNQQKGLKDNEGSQFEYQQLLDDLNFQSRKKKLQISSQNLQNPNFRFQLSEKDHSYLSKDEESMYHQKEEDQKLKKKTLLKNRANFSLSDRFKWDPCQEILFKKQNKIKRIFQLISKKLFAAQGEAIKNIKATNNTLKKHSNQKKQSKEIINLKKYKLSKKRKESSRIFKSQKSNKQIE